MKVSVVHDKGLNIYGVFLDEKALDTQLRRESEQDAYFNLVATVTDFEVTLPGDAGAVEGSNGLNPKL